jgi:hypothetical protein
VGSALKVVDCAAGPAVEGRPFPKKLCTASSNRFKIVITRDVLKPKTKGTISSRDCVLVVGGLPSDPDRVKVSTNALNPS